MRACVFRARALACARWMLARFERVLDRGPSLFIYVRHCSSLVHLSSHLIISLSFLSSHVSFHRVVYLSDFFLSHHSRLTSHARESSRLFSSLLVSSCISCIRSSFNRRYQDEMVREWRRDMRDKKCKEDGDWF